MKALEILKEINEQINRSSDYGFVAEVHYNKAYQSRVKKAIKELEDLQKDMHIITDDRRTLKDFVFTNCNECINKVDNRFTETCFSCKRYYGCYFEKKKIL